MICLRWMRLFGFIVRQLEFLLLFWLFLYMEFRAEGLYQLLIFTQVVLAMMLPSSVVSLFRVASSRSIMGIYKMSQFLEVSALITLIGMLGLNIIFAVELLFGNSELVGVLKRNMGSSTSLSYILLITASASLVLMLWLAATPLKSATLGPDAQVWNWELHNSLPESSVEVTEVDLNKLVYHEDTVAELTQERSVESYSDTSVVEYDFPKQQRMPYCRINESWTFTFSVLYLYFCLIIY